MPTYEYVCTECGHRLEAVQSFSDPALTTCPDCEGTLRKVFGNVGIVLKGSGFYKTDSRSSGGSNGAKPREKEKESTSSVSETSSKSSDASKDSGSSKDSSSSTPSSTPASGSSEKAAASST